MRPAFLLLPFVLGCTYSRTLPLVQGDAAPIDARTGAAADAGAERGLPDATERKDAAAEPDGPPAADAAPGCPVGQKMGCYGGPAGTAGTGLCRAGERTCLADGTWSACGGEQGPMPERCNGDDEDCDGVVDDGCPVDGAMLGGGQRLPASPVLGSLTLPRAVAFTDACPDGQAVVAFTGNYGSGIDALGVRCGKLQVREDRSVKPYRYELVIAPGQEFSPRGGAGGLANGVDARMRCPLNEVAVGLSAWLDPKAPEICPSDYCPYTGVLCASVYGLTVSCAAHELTGSPGNFRLARAGSAHTVSERIGTVLGVGEVENPYACPAEGLMREVKGAFGVWPLDCGATVINGLQLTCSNPTVPVIPGDRGGSTPPHPPPQTAATSPRGER